MQSAENEVWGWTAGRLRRRQNCRSARSDPPQVFNVEGEPHDPEASGSGQPPSARPASVCRRGHHEHMPAIAAAIAPHLQVLRRTGGSRRRIGGRAQLRAAGTLSRLAFALWFGERSRYERPNLWRQGRAVRHVEQGLGTPGVSAPVALYGSELDEHMFAGSGLIARCPESIRAHRSSWQWGARPSSKKGGRSRRCTRHPCRGRPSKCCFRRSRPRRWHGQRHVHRRRPKYTEADTKTRAEKRTHTKLMM